MTDQKALMVALVVMISITLAFIVGILVGHYTTNDTVQSKCVEQTKARIYEWDGTTQMMYDENC